MSDDGAGPDPLHIVGFALPDAARALGISNRTMRRRLESGAITAFSVPRCRLIAPDELQRLLVKQVSACVPTPKLCAARAIRRAAISSRERRHERRTKRPGSDELPGQDDN